MSETNEDPMLASVAVTLGKGWTVDRFTRIDRDTDAKQTGFRISAKMADRSVVRSSMVWLNDALIDACPFLDLLPSLVKAMAYELVEKLVEEQGLSARAAAFLIREKTAGLGESSDSTGEPMTSEVGG